MPSPARGDRSQVAGTSGGIGRESLKSQGVWVAGRAGSSWRRRKLCISQRISGLLSRCARWNGSRVGSAMSLIRQQKTASFCTPILLSLSLSFKTYPWSLPPRPRRCRSTLPRKLTRAAAPFAEAAGRAVALRVDPPTASRPFGLPSFPRQCSAAACGLRPGPPPPYGGSPDQVGSTSPDRGPCGAMLLKGGQAARWCSTTCVPGHVFGGLR